MNRHLLARCAVFTAFILALWSCGGGGSGGGGAIVNVGAAGVNLTAGISTSTSPDAARGEAFTNSGGAGGAGSTGSAGGPG